MTQDPLYKIQVLCDAVRPRRTAGHRVLSAEAVASTGRSRVPDHSRDRDVRDVTGRDLNRVRIDLGNNLRSWPKALC